MRHSATPPLRDHRGPLFGFDTWHPDTSFSQGTRRCVGFFENIPSKGNLLGAAEIADQNWGSAEIYLLATAKCLNDP
jgi:hypothetical protein